MIGSVSASRRANAFAEALEEQQSEGTATGRHEDVAPGGHTRTADDTIQARLLTLAGGLEAVPRPELDLEVKTVHRAQLIAAMETALAEERGSDTVPEQRAGAKASSRQTGLTGSLRKLRPRSRLTKSLAAGSLTVGVAAGAFTGVAAASTDALPGDSLYGLKRGMEDFKLGLASNDVERGEVYLRQASTRLKEARRLLERQRSGQLDDESLGEIRRTLSGMRHDASEGHRLLSGAFDRDGSLTPIQSLSSFTDTHRRSWGELREHLPTQLTDVGDQVSSVFDAIDSRVDPMRSRLPSAPSDKGTADPPKHPSAENTLSAPTSPGTRPTHTKDSGESNPNASEADEGLLNGGSGLLDPPSHTSPTPSETGRKSDAPSDVTLAPLIPELLSDLDLHSKSDG